MGKIRVIVIDDQRLVHQAIETVFSAEPDIEVVAYGKNGTEAVELCEQHQPDIVLLDIMMPQMDGITAAGIIRKCHPNTRIVMVSSSEDDEVIRRALQNGVSGYILKNALLTDLVSAVRAVHQGNSVFAQPVTSSLLKSSDAAVTYEDFGLTRREREILKLMAEGLSMAQIAEQLVISTSTVKFHQNNILRKMDVATRAEAIVHAAKNELI